MKVTDLNREVVKVRQKNQSISEGKDSVRDMLSIMFNVIERFEAKGDIGKKSETEKVDILKSLISDMLKDEDRQKVINGGV